jgi:DNA-binding MarR family transcriptional regulator
MNKFSKHITGEDLYMEFLQALRGVLKLTNREIEVLAELIDLDVQYTPIPDEPKDVTNEDNRFIIQQRLGVSRANLSTVLKSLKDKGCLTTKNGSTEVTRSLIPDVIKDRVQIILLLKLPWPDAEH